MAELSDHAFRLLVASVEDYAIYMISPAGTILSWNAGAQRLKGWTADEIIGAPYARFFSEEDRASGKPGQLLASALRNGRAEDYGWRVRKDGTQFWAHATIATLRERDGRHIGFAKVTHDLTDRGYRAFVEATSSIVWTTDAAGHPNADSPSWRAFTGQTEEAWRGMRGWEPVHPDDVGPLQAMWAHARATAHRFDARFRLRRHDGVYVHVAVHAIPFLDEAGLVREWFGVTTDISAQVAAEDETRRTLQTLETTLHSIGDAVIATDVHGDIRFMNPVAETLTGWSSADARGRDLHEVFQTYNEETREVVECPVDKVLRDGCVVGLTNHTVLRRRDGLESPIDDSAAPIRGADGVVDGVVLVFRDASEEKRELLRRAFLAQATEQLISADDYRDALTRVAQLAVPRLADWVSVHIVEPGTSKPVKVALAHVDPAKLELARWLADRYPPEPNESDGVARVLRTGRAELYPDVAPELLSHLARDGEHLQVLRDLQLRSGFIVPLRGKAGVFGTITFILAGPGKRRYSQRDLDLAEDLAGRAALIIERRRLEEEAARANRMKDDFLATMSHELRTPLQAILGYTALLERGSATDPPKALAAVRRNAEAQARLIEDILDVSRIITGKLRLAIAPVDLAATLHAALESIRPAAQAKKITLVEALPADLPLVCGDAERLQQIFWNLISNAVKFTPNGGAVEVRAERREGEVRLSVRDTGIGIAPEHIDAVFERFRQVDSSTTRQRGGLGLGLAIVRHLVEAHGGTVSAESDGTNLGATFTVALPAGGEAAGASSSSSKPMRPDERPLHGMRLLLVEDDEDARTLLAEVLEWSGAQVTTAGSAAEAFTALRSEPPHLVISDIGMPDEDGYALLRRVRALPPEHGGDVPAIALTAYARPEDARAAVEAGYQQHLVKPVKPDDLLGAVRLWARQ